MALPTLLDEVELLPAFTRLANTVPAPRERRMVAGLHGSSDAAVIAALARRLERRFFVIVTEQVPDAERWLADLEMLLENIPVAFYPPRESLGETEPHAEVAGERVETLEQMARGDVRVLITTARALLEKTQLPAALASGRLELRKGDIRRLTDLSTHLDAIGFERVEMIDDVGQFSVRGGIFDVYGFGMANPVRMEFFDDEIADLRYFDLTTQRSTREADVALILPVDGYVGDDDERNERISITALWAQDTVLVIPQGTHIEPEFRRTWDEAQHHLDLARRRGEDAPKREELYVTPDDATKTVRSFGTILLDAEGPVDVGFPFRAPEVINRDLKQLNRLVRDYLPTIILCDNVGQIERLDELLTSNDRFPSPAALVLGVLSGGFVIPAQIGVYPGLRVLTDHEIFRRERRIRRARKYVTGGGIETLGALTPGDYVVHLEHGIGIYRGIEKVFVGEAAVEVAVIEYEGGDRLNVPLYRIDQIERYRSSGDVSESAPPPLLHKLGGKRWTQQRDKTRAAIQEMTVELLDLYARRKIAVRPPSLPDTAWQRQLESSFLFEDTPDQRRATTDVKTDMEGPRPMDRLLVGDVGYGKTEIAVRAAFKTIQSERQVVVLVPTTILAEQHARTFGERFADFPVIVKVMSRFQSAKEQAEVLKDLATKKVDVVIGTHRLLSPDVKFADLGLLIIDEEHRFGVKHKERLKQLRLETDVLTLTATPIPRTLHQSLAGLRDMTLMQTPPRDRSPVLTSVEPWDEALIDEGISRELDRGGQVFFVHNRVETIDAIAQHIRRVIPRARIGVGHGQMPEKALEKVMRQFVEGEIDVLVSTLIVESGLDVPNANTMFINRADMFGLAQMYQLRGRVGRSHRRAYCYLLVPDTLDEDAERRLKILEHHTELGAGYKIALKDMELRGAGNLLGPEQSGFVHTVGFDLYLRLLNDTVHQVIRGDDGPKLHPSDVSLDVPAYMPDEYVVSKDAKLDIYRRLTAMTEPPDIDTLRDEVRDRFGPLPAEAQNFFQAALLRVLGGKGGVETISVRGDEARITFRGSAVPSMKGISAAFHEVQFQAEVRRAHPLSLKLTRLGGAGMLDGLVRALTSVQSPPSTPR
ncbi:MAG TPA: transcription-repair coupling factor [Gemmatimonadaceae bacterium]|jgi:transcription-repair coupling factor (superfamily II helicase)|nr:transcription-repair coupling factor [Gemmatimonadaceae bacterium]